MDPDIAVRVSAGLAAIASVLAAAEWAALRPAFGDEGHLRWRLASSRGFALRFPRWRRLLAWVFDEPTVWWLPWIQLSLGCGTVVAATFGASLVVWVTTLALAMLLLNYRHIYGLDGSDQMALLVVTALAIGLLTNETRLSMTFIAAQASLAYFVSGVAKLRGRVWRSGDAVPLILSTRSYGFPQIGGFLQHMPWAGKAATWSTIAFECAFPVALFGPLPIVMAMLATGLAFHVASAGLMGLNVFPWAFAATYPAILYLVV